MALARTQAESNAGGEKGLFALQVKVTDQPFGEVKAGMFGITHTVKTKATQMYPGCLPAAI